MEKILMMLMVTGSLIPKPTQCSIGGISYLDPLSFRPLPKYKRSEDPCHPLYWYPRQIPDWCNLVTEFPPLPPQPPPTPTPCPPPRSPPALPPPIPLPPLPPLCPPGSMPFPEPLPFSPLVAPYPPLQSYLSAPPPLPLPPPLALPLCAMQPCPFAYGPYVPPLYGPGQVGLVPGLPGLVTEDGGINIMPFSDAYADLLEGHKQKMIRIRLQKLLDEYDQHKWSKRRRRL